MLIGAILVLAPRLAGRMWIGRDADSRAVKVLARGLGARDVALGLGTAVAIDGGKPARGWLEGAALADAVDLVSTLLARDSIPRGARRAVIATAGASMVSCAVLARRVDESPVPDVQAAEAELTGHHS
jgi:hypothetical protein